MLKIPEQYKSLEYTRPVTWDEVFGVWRKGEAYQESWRAHWRARGFDSWEEWRKSYSSPLRPEKRDWHLYKLENSQNILEVYGVPSRGWIAKCYDGEKTKKLSALLDHPIVAKSKKVEECRNNFPKKTMLTGVVHDGKIILIEGMHRALALAQMARDGKSTKSDISMALCEYAERRLPPLGKGDDAKTVAVLGASNKPERYSNKAVKLLKEKGYRVIPVHPAIDIVEELLVMHSLDDIQDPVDVLTVYVKPEVSEGLTHQIIDLKPSVVILNPGTESPKLAAALEKACIPYYEVCTLVLLRTGKFGLLV